MEGFARWFVTLVAAPMAIACEPPMVTEAESREAYVARAPALRAHHEAVLRAIDEADVIAEPAACADRTQLLACSHARGERLDRRSRLRATLEERLTRFVDEEGLIGADLTVARRNGTSWFAIERRPCEGGYRKGSVPVREGLAFDGVRIGRGLYSTRWSLNGEEHGDDDHHPGIVVERVTDLGAVELRETYCYLLDGTRLR
jgi:hypothetical protein